MRMIICPECAKRITNNVEKCPNCECTKDKFVTLMDRKEQDLIMLRLGKYQVRFNGKYWNYIQLRRVYELNARQLRRQLRANSARTVRLFRNRRYIHSDLVVRVFCSKRYVFPLLL